jgi:hypothetical protein
MGLARIRLGVGGPAQSIRTTVPGIGSLYFTLDFTAPGKSPVNETLDGSETPALTLAVFLEPAVWNLEVNGYEDASMANHKVRGNISVSIVEGTPAAFDVYLAPDSSSGGTGSLSYSIDLSGLPASARGWLALYSIDDTPGISEEIDISSSAGGIASGILSGLFAGSYRAVIDLYDSGSNEAATWTGAAHIYDGSTTSLTRTFAAADLAPCPTVVEGTSLAAKLNAALASPAGAYTIVLDGTETDLTAFTPKILNVTGSKNITITIRGNGNEVQLGSNGKLFILRPSSGSKLTLVLQDVTLRGRAGNDSCVIQLDDWTTLLMKAGSLITGNTSSYRGGAVCVYNGGILNVSGGAISGNATTTAYGGGIYVSGASATFIMSGGAVSDNTASASSSYGGGVCVIYAATFTMSGGTISGNTASYGGGVYVNAFGGYGGTSFTMSGGAVRGNTAFYGGGVYSNGEAQSVYYNAIFTMSGGAVSDNTLSGANGYGKEVLLFGTTFRISGGARPERIFLSNNSQAITISGALAGGPVPIDLGITSSAPLTGWVSKPVLQLDGSYSSGNLASLKTHFTLGKSQLTTSPYTETSLTDYKIDDNGRFVTESP